MKRRIMTGAATLGALALVLTACSSGDNGTSSSSSDDTTTDGTSETTDSATDDGAASGEAIELSMAGWSLNTTPEFQVLADAFHEKNPNVTIKLTDYNADQYETQITADLAAGSAPDLYPIKQLMTFPTFQGGGQLMDITDLASSLPSEISGVVANYEVDGNLYAMPYRSDFWYIYVNLDLFKEAGVDAPDGKWTWADFNETAGKLKAGLDAAGKSDAKAVYQHSWQSTVQGFANAQAQPDGAYLDAQWDYMVPFYTEALARQSDGEQVDLGTITSNSLTYQGQFGTQKAAMMPMGSWYVATLLAQRESGDAETFEWGLVPVPQTSADTYDNPVTFGSPTAVGINPKTDASKVDAAKEFLTFIASEDAAIALTKIGITPVLTTDTVADELFKQEGMPTDDISRFAFTTHDMGLEVPLGDDSPALSNILKDTHTEIMSGSISPEDGINKAIELAKKDVLG